MTIFIEGETPETCYFCTHRNRERVPGEPEMELRCLKHDRKVTAGGHCDYWHLRGVQLRENDHGG